MEQDIKRMKELINILNEASVAYYQNSVTIMTDYEYDKLYDELVDIEARTGMVLSNSPTNRVQFRLNGRVSECGKNSRYLGDKNRSFTDTLDERGVATRTLQFGSKLCKE